MESKNLTPPLGDSETDEPCKTGPETSCCCSAYHPKEEVPLKHHWQDMDISATLDPAVNIIELRIGPMILNFMFFPIYMMFLSNWPIWVEVHSLP